MTLSESHRLIGLSLLSFVVLLVAKVLLPPQPQPLIILAAIGFIVAIYRTVPAGRGSLDFKVGVIVGFALTMAVFALLDQIKPILMRGFNL
ncbi:MAG: hypothetical protein EOP83_34230 [Verrucomicrobiaceae bacterium]|nr:MAG: hypothetical protein EOP83_34230 [Verrucomicrobiaceae bacterium]